MTAKLDHQNLAIVLGMPRAGTTTLYHWLGQHPQVFTPWRKELAYFSRNFGRGERWYRRFYSSMGNGKVGIDATPEYFMERMSTERILGFNSKMRAILIVRDPVEWAPSVYAQLRRVGIPESFEEFVQGFNYERGGAPLRVVLGMNAVRDRITAIRHAFGDNLLLIDFQQLGSDPTSVLVAIENFLGLSAHFGDMGVTSLQLNRRSERPAGIAVWMMSHEMAHQLVDRFVPAKMMEWLRRYYYRSQRGQEVASATSDPKQRAIAEEIFGPDRQFVRDLFAESPFVIGSRRGQVKPPARAATVGRV